MKKTIFAVVAAMTMSVFAADEMEKSEAPIFWGFANYGIYSGYQLYGSLVNDEPTLQGYAEENANLNFDGLDFGYLGLGLWSNTDLTPRRRHNRLGNAFNEWDFNIHWGKTFWFDDDQTWGLTYRSSIVWYWYPPKNYQGSYTDHEGNHQYTTMDWDHYFELQNPYLIPYLNVVHEYVKTSNLLQFGVKKPFQITDQFSLCPILEAVWRDRNYGWCFPHYGQDENWDKISSGIATVKVELDATYMFTANFGAFAKIAFCTTVDNDLRDAADINSREYFYGQEKDFFWGGAGLCFNF